VVVEVSVTETKRALPSAGEFNPESTTSSMLLMYSWFAGGWMAGWLIERATRQEICKAVLIIALKCKFV